MSDQTNVLVPEYPILPLLAERRSPRAYTNQPVSAEALQQLFTAAGSAASNLGEQPWRFIVGSQQSSPEAFQKILGTLVEFNQTWAKNAAVLVLSLAKKTLSHDSNPNPFGRHDVGQAVATLAIQAAELGMQIHQMAGFSPEAARTAFQVPDEYEVVSTFTIGYPGNVEVLPDFLQQRELAPRVRRSLAEFVFEGGWPQPKDERYDQVPV